MVEKVKMIYKGYLTHKEKLEFLNLFAKSDVSKVSDIKIQYLVTHSTFSFTNFGVYSKKEINNHPKGANKHYTIEDYKSAEGKDVILTITCYSELIYDSFYNGMLKSYREKFKLI